MVNLVARSVFFCAGRQGLLATTDTDRLRSDQLGPFLRCSKRYIDDLSRLSLELAEQLGD